MIKPTIPFLAAFALSSVSPSQDPGPGGIPACEEMQTTASGLQWGVLSPGKDGASPTANDMVEVHYTGWLTDGTKFDSSRDRGRTSKFGVNQVIKGWTEGLQLMKPGMRCKFVIPGDLAYGAQGRPPRIPANATLVFDVELVDVIRMPAMPAANADKQQTLDNGIKYEVLTVGTGDMIAKEDAVALRYAVWRPNGELIDCTERQNGRKLSGKLGALPVSFFDALVANWKKGERWRLEVPQSVFGNFQTDTVWELELVDVVKKPEFRMPAADKVVTTQSGLKYEVLAPGEGDTPKATDRVLAHYTGWLTDGTTFDSSHERGEPTEFGLNQVIAGWTEGLQLMKPGGKFLFEIPAELGYGDRQSGKIPPGSTLVFFVELVEVR